MHISYIQNKLRLCRSIELVSEHNRSPSAVSFIHLNAVDMIKYKAYVTWLVELINRSDVIHIL